MPADPATETGPRRPRPPGTFRIGQFAGVDVLVTSSWFLIAALIAFVLAPVVEETQPGLGAWKYLAGVAFAVLLYLSVLLHEASHAIAAQRYGHVVDSITLHFLGGATAIEGEARSAREEFWISVVGPLTSLLVGLVVLPLWWITPDGLLALALQGLIWANVVVGVLNLIPGLPLDGGRVLKSAVWGLTGNPHRGTIAAGWGGRLAALAVVGWPWVMDPVIGVRPTVFDTMLAVVIALFLWTGATAAMRGARIRRRLVSIVAKDLARRTLTVRMDLPVAEAVRRAQEADAGGIVTTDAEGRPIGIVNEAALVAVPDERRPWLPVSDVTRTLEDGLSLPVEIAGEELIKAITRHPAHEYLLLEPDGRIYGVLATSDVDAAFSA
ncbi:site-2 protease family protein [Nocardioides daejeonensis]|uniref:site-2 protease family protein n=1 Tax=Nocardioides daejeonensis TaxID=1046556 RepID=UPI000D740A29|nr:site-2 protease family protein [Nocardioides daejeonensis]